MTVEEFINNLGTWAHWAAPKVGLHPEVILAQWADETGWGTSEAWVAGHNPAGISPGGHVAAYPTVGDGMTHYVQTMNLPYYNDVRAHYAAGPVAQAIALGASPWAGGHYGGAAHPGADLVSIIENELKGFGGAPAPHPTPAPAPPTWHEQAAAHWQYTEAVAKVLEAWYIVFNRHPVNPAEWHEIATWGFDVSSGSATLGAVITAMSANAGAQVRLKAA